MEEHAMPAPEPAVMSPLTGRRVTMAEALAERDRKLRRATELRSSAGSVARRAALGWLTQAERWDKAIEKAWAGWKGRPASPAQKRCTDCGHDGHEAGAMECQCPQDQPRDHADNAQPPWREQ